MWVTNYSSEFVRNTDTCVYTSYTTYMLMNALKYDVYTDNDFNVSKLSNRIQILKSWN